GLQAFTVDLLPKTAKISEKQGENPHALLTCAGRGRPDRRVSRRGGPRPAAGPGTGCQVDHCSCRRTPGHGLRRRCSHGPVHVAATAVRAGPRTHAAVCRRLRTTPGTTRSE